MARFLPLQDRILLKRVEAATQYGMIHIPDANREKPSEGIVVAVGPGRILENGQLVEPRVKTGDRVLFGKYTGAEIRIDDVEHVVCHESDLLGVFAENP